MPDTKNVVIRFSSDTMGRGDDELGERLAASFINVLAEIHPNPGAMVFYNRGVFLCSEGSPVLDVLKEFSERGVPLLCCGTCLNHFELNDKLVVGSTSNMVEITQTMLSADMVIPL